LKPLTPRWDGLQIQFYTGPGQFSLFARQAIHHATTRAFELAKGEPVLEGRALTGTITDQGAIGAVGGLQLKILAAYDNHFQRVLIPAVYDIREDDWRTPFLMHVSPVTTIEEAYLGLTGHPLLALS